MTLVFSTKQALQSNTIPSIPSIESVEHLENIINTIGESLYVTTSPLSLENNTALLHTILYAPHIVNLIQTQSDLTRIMRAVGFCFSKAHNIEARRQFSALLFEERAPICIKNSEDVSRMIRMFANLFADANQLAIRRQFVQVLLDSSEPYAQFIQTLEDSACISAAIQDSFIEPQEQHALLSLFSDRIDMPNRKNSMNR